MNNINATIIKLLLLKEIWKKYNKKIHNKEVFKYLQVIESLHSATDEDISFSEFRALMLIKDEKASEWLDQAEKADISEVVADKVFETWIHKEWANSLALKAIDMVEGRQAYEDVKEVFDSYLDNTTYEDLFVTGDFEKLWEKNRRDGGILWRTKALNEAIGGLRKGDFGFFFARTNIGKTSCIANEISYMIKHIENPVLYCSNEESGERIYFRIAESFFGVDRERLGSNLKKAEEAFVTGTGGKLKIYEPAGMSIWDIEKTAAMLNPSLIVIDNLDKVYGFKNERDDLRLGKLYQWARELAKKYAPVIAVCQAGASAEGKKWLQITDIDCSHTSKQKEADWIIGMGISTDDGCDNIRYFNIVKNKFGSGKSKFSSKFNSATSRFEEMK